MAIESGITGTTENLFTIGDGTSVTDDGYKYLYAKVRDDYLPGLRWNEVDVQWEFSNDGYVWTAMGSGGGVSYPILPTQGGTGLITYVSGDILYANGVDSLAVLTIGSDAEVLTLAGGVPTWAPISSGTSDHNLLENLQGGEVDGYYHFTDPEHTWLLDGYTDGYWVETKGGTGVISYAEGDILYADGVNSLTALARGSDTEVLTLSGGVPTWAAASGGIVETAINNVAGGTGALANITASSGNYNTAFGYNAGNLITTGDNSVFIGTNAGAAFTIQNNLTIIGSNASANLASVSRDNVIVGSSANSTATAALYASVIIGHEAGQGISGSANVIIGTAACAVTNTIKNNVIIGYGAASNITADDTIVIGYNAGDSIRAIDDNIIIGTNCGSGGTNMGVNNIAIGSAAFQATNSTAASENIVIGTNSGNDITSGRHNIFLGAHSGDSVTTGQSSVILGYYADGATNISYTHIIGYYASAIEQDTITIGRFTKAAHTDTFVVGYGTNATTEVFSSIEAHSALLGYPITYFGKGIAENITLYAYNDQGSKPYLRYDEAGSKWIGSNNGSDEYDLESTGDGYATTLYKDTTPILYTDNSPSPFNGVSVICDGYFLIEPDFPLPIIGMAPSSSHAGTTLILLGQTDYTNTFAGGDVQIWSGDGYSAGDIYLKAGNSNMGNIIINGSEGTNMQGAEGAIFIKEADVVPTGNPTDGGYLFIEGGALKYKGGTSGTVTIIAPA